MRENGATDELTETLTFRIAQKEKVELKELARMKHVTMGDILRALVREEIVLMSKKVKR